MRWTRRFLVVLALLSLGCARGDWISETVQLVDATGTWEGTWRRFCACVVGVRWVVQRGVTKVVAASHNLDGTLGGRSEGEVSSSSSCAHTFLSLGCARGDWTTETLTQVDVTGTWEEPCYGERSG